jgi:hypothetical protein
MKNNYLIFFLLLFSCKLSFAQQLQWVSPLTGAGLQNVKRISTDALGNTYMVGFFTGTVDLDPDSTNSVNHVAIGSSDIFIVKLDVNGKYRWSRTFGSAAADEGSALAIGNNGEVVLGGLFQQTMNVDPGNTNTTLVAAGSFDACIVKFDTAGNFIWARKFSGTNSSEDPINMCIDQLGNIYTLGHYGNTVDFDPGIGVLNLTSAGGFDIYVTKLNTAGNLVWAKSLGGIGSETAGDIEIDQHHRLLIGGAFRQTVDFDLGTGIQNRTSTGTGSDNFILKVDTAFNFLWVATFGSTGFELNNALSISKQNEIISVGYFGATVDFNPGTGTNTLTALGVVDVYILKLDSTGGYLWAKRIGGTDNQTAVALCLDDSGNIYTGGWFKSTVDFDPNAGVYNLTSNGNEDAFLVKLSPTGNFMYAHQAGGTGFEIVNGLAYHAGTEQILAGGQFNTTVDFDPGPGLKLVTSAGGADGFLWSTGAHLTILPVKYLSFDAQWNQDKVELNWQTASEQQNKGFYIEISEHASAFKEIGFVKGQGNSLQRHHYAFSFPYHSNSCFIRLRQVDYDGKEHLSQTIALERLGQLMNLYPNPTKEFITVSGIEPNEEIVIYNSIGALQYRCLAQTETQKIDMKDWQNGLYFLHVKKPHETIVMRLLKE